MKFSLALAVAALTSSAVAQGFSTLPPCARHCAINAIPSKCGLLNFRCICTDQSFVNKMGCCISNRCDQTDQESALRAAAEICARAGVSQLPLAVECSSTAPGALASTEETTASGTESTSTEEMTTSGTESTSTEAMTTSVTESTSTEATTTRGTESRSGTSGASATSTLTSTTSASPPATTGGAVLCQHKDSSLVAAAGAAAALAMLV